MTQSSLALTCQPQPDPNPPQPELFACHFRPRWERNRTPGCSQHLFSESQQLPLSFLLRPTIWRCPQALASWLSSWGPLLTPHCHATFWGLPFAPAPPAWRRAPNLSD